jgi:hypothetical protein
MTAKLGNAPISDSAVGTPAPCEVNTRRTNFGSFSGLCAPISVFCRHSVLISNSGGQNDYRKKSLFPGGFMVGAPRFELGTPSPPAKNNYISGHRIASQKLEKPLLFGAF